jgi:hypothetical protein
MAAGDHTLGVLLDTQARIGEIFTEGAPAFAEYRYPTPTLNRFLQRQTAQATPVQAGQQNIGVRVSWLKSGVDSVTHDGTAVPAGLTCTLTGGTRLEVDQKIYNDNLYIVSKLAVKNTDLAQRNIWQAGRITDGPGFSNFMATLITKGVVDIRKKLNRRVFSFMDANKQLNLDTLVANNNVNGSGAWSVNADLATIQAPINALQNGNNVEDSLVTFDTILQNNDFTTGEYDVYSGYNNFRARFNVAPFKAENDNERSGQATFDAFNIFFDVRDLDQLLTGRNSFAVDRNSYIMTNRVLGDAAPRQFDATKWEFAIDDPILQINDGGTLRPLRYNVIYQELCAERNMDMSLAMDYQLEVRLQGVLATAPAGTAGQTGIMKLRGI